jgi:hypothetical protein
VSSSRRSVLSISWSVEFMLVREKRLANLAGGARLE